MKHYLNWKFFLLLITVITAGVSLYQVRIIAEKMGEEESRRLQIHINALQVIVHETMNNDDFDINLGYQLATKIISENESIPIIITDEFGEIMSYNNIDSNKVSSSKNYLNNKLEEYENMHGSIKFDNGYNIQYVYYGDSEILEMIKLYPYVILIISFSILLSLIIALINKQKSIQNQVWVGMSKETAHQLGTPITSVMSWMEILDQNPNNTEYISEMRKDVDRLQLVVDRFSKIGSVPQLKEENVVSRIRKTVDYMQLRAPQKVKISLESNEDNVDLLIIGPLLDWVFENLIKNALDAMEGQGEIKVKIVDEHHKVTIDVCDTGKGIKKQDFNSVFKPGYSTKMRGWGLGLSLAKRIIKEYHGGSIFVKQSELGKGTTFRIIFRR